MLRTRTGKKPLLAGLGGGGGRASGTRELRGKTSRSKKENHKKFHQHMTSPPGFEPRPKLLPNIFLFTCLTVSACKTFIDHSPSPRLPLGIPAKIAIPRALFYSSSQPPCDTKRSLQRRKAIDHFSLNLC